MKRLITRLMLFGIPCAFSYLVTRPASQPPAPAFVVCSVPDASSEDAGQVLVIAVNAAACEKPASTSLRLEDPRKTDPAAPIIRPGGYVSPPLEDLDGPWREQRVDVAF